MKQNTLHCFHYFSKILLFNLSTGSDFRVHRIFSLRSFSSLNTSLKQFELLYFSKRSMNGYKWIILNSFSTNIPVMDNPGSWFLLPKCLKNTCGRVTFLHLYLKCHSFTGFSSIFVVENQLPYFYLSLTLVENGSTKILTFYLFQMYLLKGLIYYR